MLNESAYAEAVFSMIPPEAKLPEHRVFASCICGRDMGAVSDHWSWLNHDSV